MSDVRAKVSRFLVVALMASSVVLASCATLFAPPEERVGERASARYAALIAGKYDVAYGFFTPAFRDAWTYREHLLMRPPVVTYSQAKLVSVKCETDDACTVGVDVVYRPAAGVRGVPNGLDISRFNEEKWIRVSGQWWLYQPE